VIAQIGQLQKRPKFLENMLFSSPVNLMLLGIASFVQNKGYRPTYVRNNFMLTKWLKLVTKIRGTNLLHSVILATTDTAQSD
jgi:hypothetical protein